MARSIFGGRVPGRRGQRGRSHRSPDRVEGRAGRRGVRGRPDQPEGRGTRTSSRWSRRTCRPSPTRSCPTRSRSRARRRSVQMFGPAQAAVARAVVDSVREGVIPEARSRTSASIVGVFIHWEAADDKKIFDYNYQATKESIARALGSQPTPAGHPRRRGRGAAPVRRGSRGVATPDPTPQPCEPRLDGARAVVTGASSGIGAGDRRGVRRRRRDRAPDVPPQRGGRASRSPTASRRAAAARSSRAPTSARARAARRSSRRRASGSAASTCGSTTPAPTCSPATRPTGTGSASSTCCSPSTSRAPSRARTRPAR